MFIRVFFLLCFISSTVFSQQNSSTKVAYFASGCFWCVEEIFESVKGVEEAVSGYAGGRTKNPSYREVGAGNTGHAEAVAVYYNPEIISFDSLVDVFYASQDPTTIGQNPDFGSQYRSIIFYQNEDEKNIANAWFNKISAGALEGKVVTEILPFKVFYEAEEYHQDFVKKHPNHGYVKNVSIPRLENFKAKRKYKLK